MKTCFLLVLLFSVHPVQESEDLFRKGMEELNESRSDKAVLTFEKVLSQGYESAALYNNLGVSFLQTHRIGYAILNFEKALLMNPRDSRIKQNAKFAKSKVSENHSSENMKAGFFTLNPWLFFYSVDELAKAGITLLMLGLFLMSYSFFSKENLIGKSGKYFLIAASFVILAASLQFYVHKTVHRAVIVWHEVSVRYSASQLSKETYILPEGTIVNVRDNFEGWCKVGWAGNKQGWITNKSLKEITLGKGYLH